ncbi:hypothetical protein Q5P01_023090 [Channa striata]|uniref:Uncharacterized protein n=1 Tax=Channa striata TaxID=64152 RepID=A0AA88LQS6_CHASR|nr:hypothetical protein Q5P01_023090 [Channa striata]
MSGNQWAEWREEVQEGELVWILTDVKGNQSQLHFPSAQQFPLCFPRGRCFCPQDSERPELEAEPSDRELGKLHDLDQDSFEPTWTGPEARSEEMCRK